MWNCAFLALLERCSCKTAGQECKDIMNSSNTFHSERVDPMNLLGHTWATGWSVSTGWLHWENCETKFWQNKATPGLGLSSCLMCFYFWYFLIIRCALVPKTSEAKVLLARQNFVSAARFGYFLRRGLQRQGLRGTLGSQAISGHPTHLGTISSFIAADLFLTIFTVSLPNFRVDDSLHGLPFCKWHFEFRWILILYILWDIVRL